MIRLIPAFVVMVLDLTLTLWLQPDEYWSNHSRYCEQSPTGRLLLGAGPWFYSVVSALYVILCLVLITKLPKRLGLIAIIFLLISHSHGAATWLSKLYYRIFLVEANDEWCLAMCCGLVIAIIAGNCLGDSPAQAGKESANKA